MKLTVLTKWWLVFNSDGVPLYFVVLKLFVAPPILLVVMGYFVDDLDVYKSDNKWVNRFLKVKPEHRVVVALLLSVLVTTPFVFVTFWHVLMALRQNYCLFQISRANMLLVTLLITATIIVLLIKRSYSRLKLLSGR